MVSSEENPKYAVVTGCSPSSIGYQVAVDLAVHHGYHVIVASRSAAIGDKVQADILQQGGEATFLSLDLASFDSIRAFAERIKKDLPLVQQVGLSLLIHNAGIAWAKPPESTPLVVTENGQEEILQVNHFGPFLLTYLLLQDLQRADTSRIVFVTSGLHDPNLPKKKNQSEEEPLKILVENVSDCLAVPKKQEEESDQAVLDGLRQYRISKLCQFWFAYELHRRLQQQGSNTISINCVSPGFIPSTGLIRRQGWLAYVLAHYLLEPLRYIGLVPSFLRSKQDGSQSVLLAATQSMEDHMDTMTYWSLPNKASELKLETSSQESHDATKAQECWKLSAKACGIPQESLLPLNSS